MRTILTVIAVTAALVAAGCGSTHSSGRLAVVASTNVYGDIARQIGGGHVDVSSILSDPNADPHLFEAGTRNALAVAHAGVVIENGLGYDSFVDTLEASAPAPSRTTVNVADVLGAHGRSANPHLWYDTPELGRIASAIADSFVHADSGHAAAYRAGLRRFDAALGPLRAEVAAIRRAEAGAPVASTEPVAGYLVAAAGLRDLAPAAFTRAIEDGTEPPPSALAALSHLLSGGRVRALLYNDQAVSPITARVRAIARGAGIPVVGFSETLPAGETFQSWQLRQVRALHAAVAR